MKKVMVAALLWLGLVATGCRKNEVAPDMGKAAMVAKGVADDRKCLLDPPPVCPPCAEIYAPVCGCDGVTYFNACVAICIGVPQYQSGACPSVGVDTDRP